MAGLLVLGPGFTVATEAKKKPHAKVIKVIPKSDADQTEIAKTPLSEKTKTKEANTKPESSSEKQATDSEPANRASSGTAPNMAVAPEEPSNSTHSRQR